MSRAEDGSGLSRATCAPTEPPPSLSLRPRHGACVHMLPCSYQALEEMGGGSEEPIPIKVLDSLPTSPSFLGELSLVFVSGLEGTASHNDPRNRVLQVSLAPWGPSLPRLTLELS